MPSVIRGSDNFDTAGGNAVKAWVNFNGTGTVAIRASYNVSSITDNGVGDYTVNFATALADANYSISGMTTGATGAGLVMQIASAAIGSAPTLQTTSQIRIITGNTTGLGDVNVASASIFR